MWVVSRNKRDVRVQALMECPTCHQPLPEVRFGVRLTRLKAMIFDVIKSRSSYSVTQQELQGIFELSSLATVRSHIFQINEMLEHTGWRIKGGSKHHPGYRLVKQDEDD